MKDIRTEAELTAKMKKRFGDGYFVLNTPDKEIYRAVLNDPGYFMLEKGAGPLAGKQIVMLDEHTGNAQLASTLKNANKAGFDYQVWATDHPFSNKRVALIKKVLAFLDK